MNRSESPPTRLRAFFSFLSERVSVPCLRAFAVFILLNIAALPTPAFAADKESAYERVVSTGTIRCGYNYWEPVVMRNERTGELHGLFVEYMHSLAEAAGLAIEWAQETDWGAIQSDLETGKIDAFCAGVWADARRSVHIAFTKPAFYVGIEAYGRADDDRFTDGDLSRINHEDVTIALHDGATMQKAIAEMDFPNAQTFVMTHMQGDADLLFNVMMGKADVAFTSNAPAAGFMRANPGALKRIAPREPLRINGSTIAIDIDDYRLRSLLDGATEELINNGTLDKLVSRYNAKYPGAFLPVSKPYTAPDKSADSTDKNAENKGTE
ncbi:MAG: transporter substrate-binding domain-containing protein [Alphaproteobacteria bacterium]|nr:transporter substrate-binding domain-containing protein [Alphaproteobacteria bacterium]